MMVPMGGSSWGGGSGSNYGSGGAYSSTPGGAGNGSTLKYMPPGHFCPDVCGIEDFGEADTWRGKTVRAFFKLMRYWPKPGAV